MKPVLRVNEEWPDLPGMRRGLKAFRRAGFKTPRDLMEAIEQCGLERSWAYEGTPNEGYSYIFAKAYDGEKLGVWGAGPVAWSRILGGLSLLGFDWQKHIKQTWGES